MKYLLSAFFLISPLFSVSAQINASMVSSVAVLTIHVSDTNIHQSVVQILRDVMKLPVQYGPAMLGQRRYAAVYAGNMFIEPCGPYSNMRYPVRDFKALFFGLNCRSGISTSSLTNNLHKLNIPFEQVGTDEFRILDDLLSDGIYLAVSTGPISKADLDKQAAFHKAMDANQREALGLEYVSEVWLGCTSSADLNRWNEFLSGSAKIDDACWSLNNHQRIRLVKSEVRGVQGIVWKAQSLEKAERYLKENNCFGRRVDGKIELDKRRTYGLLMCISE